jgi:hypothetical protein
VTRCVDRTAQTLEKSSLDRAEIRTEMRSVGGLGVVCDERFRVYEKEINEVERRSDIREGRLLKTSSLGSSLVELALYQNAASSSMSIVSVSAKKHRVKRRSNQLRCPQMNSGRCRRVV